MFQEDTTDNPPTKRIKQTISVPFLWEEKPGTPKWEWVRILPPNPLIQLPIKLIASVPFQWEEEPGKPLPVDSSSLQPSPELTIMHSSPTHVQEHQKNNPFCDSDSEFEGFEQDEMSEPELYPPFSPPSPELTGLCCSSLEHLQQHHESNPFCDSDEELETVEQDGISKSDESFSSAPSLLANRLIPTAEISNALPVYGTSLMEREDSGYLQAPSSPAWETDSTSSYATGATSLVGSSFLECMFPLLPPKSSFFEKTGCTNGVSHSPSKAPYKDTDVANTGSIVGKKQPTLGELMMMSRRRSYLRKAAQIRDQNLSMEFMTRTAFGCCIRVEGLQKLRRQLQLKFI